MARSVPLRAHKEPRQADQESGNEGGDTDLEETPRPPHRTFSKRRVSDVYDASFTSESGRVPLKSVNINDDAAEKRRRRKSAKPPQTEDEAGPSGVNANDREDTRVAAFARQKSQLLSMDQPPTATVPLDVMNSNFEEWMKMATDNKINAANSWNFALIDYFHDMSLLRNNTDNSINFQRASCTLDGCVKIWTSRVDSVGTETGKLLSNLANEGRGGEDEEEGDPDNPDGADPSQGSRKRKAHRAESTLAKNLAQLRNKKLDLEFKVDPLFRKTCADFDEGGAHGLLMNHLSLGVGTDGSLRVVFDASDSMGKGEEEEPLEEPPDDVDLSYLREHFMQELGSLDDKAISHSLEDFSFAKDTFSFDDTTFFRASPPRVVDDEDDENQPFEDDTGHPEASMEVDGAPTTEDFFVGDQAVGDDFVDDGPVSPDGLGAGEDGSVDPEAPSQEPNRTGAFVPFDPRRAPNERDLIMAMTDADKDGSGMMMDYFDQSFLKNWAGPEHWKLRKVVRKPEAPDTSTTKTRRERKEPFKIDFLSPPEKDLKERAKELFAPVTRGAGINLPGPAYGKSATKGSKGKKAKELKKTKRSDQTLPDDMHFSSRQLVTLFLKPKFSLRMRGQRVRLDDRPDGEVDENFWAQAAADQAAGRDNQEEDETANGGAIPFNTQFFHDDFDDGPGFDDDGEGDMPSMAEPGEQDLLAATQGQTRRVRPQYVNYAKRAKRVDVRKLKENIWKSLDIIVPEVNDDGDVDMDEDVPPATDPTEARGFTAVISGLQKSYPKDKMDDISTSFCFICLLHLANERGLKLETGADPDADSEDRNVGNIWDLQIYRDPHASPAA